MDKRLKVRNRCNNTLFREGTPSIVMNLSSLFRSMPAFKGKFRLAEFALRSKLFQSNQVEFLGKYGITYKVPNTIDAIGRELYINGSFEEGTIVLIKKLLPENGVLFDVGANIGAISIPIAKQKDIDVHAFEPTREVFSYLKHNVENNGIENIILNNVAVHSIDGINVKFFPVSDNFGHSSLAQTYSQQPHYNVSTISIDAYCRRENISRIDVLKIDVQGFETEVLKGCSRLLSEKKITNIIFEFEDWADDITNYQKGSSQELLRSYGYKIYTLDNKELLENITTGSSMLWAKLPSL